MGFYVRIATLQALVNKRAFVALAQNCMGRLTWSAPLVLLLGLFESDVNMVNDQSNRVNKYILCTVFCGGRRTTAAAGECGQKRKSSNQASDEQNDRTIIELVS